MRHADTAHVQRQPDAAMISRSADCEIDGTPINDLIIFRKLDYPPCLHAPGIFRPSTTRPEAQPSDYLKNVRF